MPELQRLGRRPFVPDARDYPLTALLAQITSTATVTRKWPDSEPVLDQGNTGHCVGFGSADWGNTLPIDDRFANADGHKLYYEAVAIGGEPNTENGAEVRWGLKALANRGRVISYHKAANYAEARAWVLSTQGGSVIIGVPWLTGMDAVSSTGLIHATGSERSGHCLLWYGSSPTAYDYLLNSWSMDWGALGRCHIAKAGLAYLIDHMGGEAWVALEKPLP